MFNTREYMVCARYPLPARIVHINKVLLLIYCVPDSMLDSRDIKMDPQLILHPLNLSGSQSNIKNVL